METQLRRIMPALCVALLVLWTGCRGSEVMTDGDYEARTPATAEVLPAGTTFNVELNETIGTEMSEPGERFTATTDRAVRARNGAVAIPAGATVYGTVTGVDESDSVGDQAAIRLDFDSIAMNGTRYDLDANVVEANVETSRADAGVTEEAAIGAAAGTALGAILGGDVLNALIGGALGAGAGTVISLGVGDVEASLPAGTDMTLRTEDRIDV